MSNLIACAALCALAQITLSLRGSAQEPGSLSLIEARALARASSSEMAAAREAVAVARGLETQAGAVANPSMNLSTERTSGGSETNRQLIVGVEQSVEIGGQRGARREAARLKRLAAQARLDATAALLDFETARRYALAVEADRRAALARAAAAAFTEATRVSEQRLAAGDISGYAARRLRLEATRYGTREAEAVLARRSARLALASLFSARPDSIVPLNAVLSDSLPATTPAHDVDALRLAAMSARAELRAATLEADASAAAARLAVRQRVPTPVLSAGFKTEESAGSPESLNGFAAGMSIPLPIWDRRRGATQAAEAEARQRAAERESVRRRVAYEVMDASDALLAAEQQVALLRPQLGEQAAAALRSARVAYAEGEITLLEWLDAVRAYHEAESTYAELVTELMVRRAALELAIGSTLEDVR